jgi:hypothetical protein
LALVSRVRRCSSIDVLTLPSGGQMKELIAAPVRPHQSPGSLLASSSLCLLVFLFSFCFSCKLEPKRGDTRHRARRLMASVFTMWSRDSSGGMPTEYIQAGRPGFGSRHGQGTWYPGYTHGHWVPFASPPTTRRATVEVFEPASTRGLMTCRSQSYFTTGS